MTPRTVNPEEPARCRSSRFWIVCALALGSLLGLGLSSARVSAEPPAPDFLLIIHPGNPVDSASREFLTEAFLKKTTRWRDGTSIRPVDQRPDSPVRRKFSESVLRRSVPAIRNYWQQRIFSGRDTPPPELDSDQAVVSYVTKHPGAVGYVSAGTKLQSAKPLALE